MYRTNTIPKSTVRLMVGNYLAVATVAATVSHSEKSTMLEKNEYHLWVNTWKANYAMISNEISRWKRHGPNLPSTQQHLQDLKLLANSMLNARHTAKDKRRAFFAAQDARNNEFKSVSTLEFA